MTTDNYPCQKHDEESRFFFVLNDFAKLVKEYGAEQVVSDLRRNHPKTSEEILKVYYD